MKLLRFAVNNFRGISGGLSKNFIDFESSSAIFIFGQNNVGKSSFLKAYLAFYEDCIGKNDFPDSGQEDIVCEVWLKILEETDKEAIEVGAGDKFRNLKEKYLDSSNVLKIRKTWKRDDGGKASFNETYNVALGSWEEIHYGGIGMHSVFKPLMMKPLFIQAMPDEAHVESIVNEILKESANKKLSEGDNEDLQKAVEIISNLQDKVYDKIAIEGYRKKVNDMFTPLFAEYEVGIDDGTSRVKFTHDKLGKEFKITFNKIGSEQISSYLQMGHGAVRMAIFLLMLMREELRGENSMQKNFLVLFEEPELFLHPILTKKLRRLIYEVSADDMPFQVLSASHSPQMIDISKDHTSLVRMVKSRDLSTSLFQVIREDLKNSEQPTITDVKNKIFEILRLDPFVCESFYADEVVLVEGDTEAIIWRGYQQSFDSKKDIFVVNCHSCVNIPFYQKLFSKFDIPYSVICDTDHAREDGENLTGWNLDEENPEFTSGIQLSIYNQYKEDFASGKSRYFFVFDRTFEPCHESLDEPIKYVKDLSQGKPFNADAYWKKILLQKGTLFFEQVPIIKYMNKISG